MAEMNVSKFVDMIRGALTVKVYADLVPEGQALPAVSFVHIAHDQSRTIAGKRTAESDTWRLSLVGESFEQIEQLCAEVDTLDNTSPTGYQRVLVRFRSSEAMPLGAAYRRYTVDIQTYEG